MGFQERLREARQRAQLTQQQVADALGIDKSTYSGYETGKREPDVLKIKRLLVLLNVPSSYLLEVEMPTVKGGLTAHEQTLLDAYRAKPEFQLSVDKLLDVDGGT